MIKSINTKEIFNNIWLSPKTTFKRINDYNYSNYAYFLLFLVGILTGIEKNSSQIINDINSFLILNTFNIFFTCLFTIVVFLILAYLLNWTGNFVGGKASTTQIQNMLAYAMIPALLSIPFVTLKILLFYEKGLVLDEYYIESSLSYQIIYFSIEFVTFILSIWSFVLVIIGLSEIQNISIIKTIVNLMLPIIFLIAVLGISIFIFSASQFQNLISSF